MKRILVMVIFLAVLSSLTAFGQNSPIPDPQLLERINKFDSISKVAPDVKNPKWVLVETGVPETANLAFGDGGSFWHNIFHLGFVAKWYRNVDEDLMAVVLGQPATKPGDVLMIYGSPEFKRMALYTAGKWFVGVEIMRNYVLNSPGSLQIKSLGYNRRGLSTVVIQLETSERMVSRKLELLRSKQ